LDYKKILSRLMNNWPAKVLSTALAVGLFVFHRMSIMQERFFAAPLKIEAGTGLIPSSSYPRTIRVTLRGDANTIYPILDEDIETFLDLTRYESPGDYRAPVQVRKKGTALGADSLEISIEPHEVSLSLDNRLSKFVPLRASLQGEVPQGYTLSSHSLNPTQVIVDGPANLIDEVSTLYTDSVDLSARTGDFTVVVNILNQDPLIVIRGNGTTEFRGIVSRVVPVRNILDIPIRVTGLVRGLSGELDQRSGSLRLEGESQEMLDQFSLPLDFLSVDCSGIEGSGTYTLPVHAAAVPPALKAAWTPAEVTILVTPALPEPNRGPR